MSTTVTVKGQITLPKEVRDAVGMKPGVKVDIRATANGTVIVEKSKAADDYKAKLYEIAKRRVIRGITTDELMEMTRGYSDDSPKKK